MTTGEFLTAATKALKQAGIESARLDCLVLLEDALGQNRARILAHSEAEIPSKTEVGLNKKIAQRAKHVPLAYLRGKVQFYGREFVVDERVLVPRPETEAMIDLLKATPCVRHSALPLRFIDLGSGSGCIGITAVLELPGAKIELWDIDPQTHQVALHNATLHGVQPTYRPADLLRQPPIGQVDAFLANLPYVPSEYLINEAAKHEPKLALFAGQDGMDLYRRFWQEVAQLVAPPPYIFTESLSDQHRSMRSLARAAGYKLAATKDLIQQFKRA
jgi:release factor glutamine methyltransferase